MTSNEQRLARLEASELQTSSRSRSSAIEAPQLPNIIEFATSYEYLGLDIFVRQATLLKLMTCATELLTDYDMQVIGSWTDGFNRSDANSSASRFVGSFGVSPDVLERMQICRDQGRRWFREIVMVMGRRSGKGFLGGILGAYGVWYLLSLDDIHAHFRIPPAKQLRIPVFAANQVQAKINQAQDLIGMIGDSKCFAPFIAERTTTMISLWSPAQLRIAEDGRRGLPAIVIEAKESTTNSGRGIASPFQFFDEIAHAAGAGATATAAEIFRSATPAMAQFAGSQFVYLASSPREQIGLLHQRYERGLRINPVTDRAFDPEILIVQLPSSEPYLDAERTKEIEMWPGGPCFRDPGDPKITEAFMKQQLAEDGENANVEFYAQWATVYGAYLPQDLVDAMFAPFDGKVLRQRFTRVGNYRYFAHVDPSTTDANTAFVIGHLEFVGDVPHVVYDVILHWKPKDFPSGHIDYEEILSVIIDHIKRFDIVRLTSDQFGEVSIIQRLQAMLNPRRGRSTTHRFEMRRATRDDNWRVAEHFKGVLLDGRLHAPHDELAELELKFLQRVGRRVDHPGSGPVQTKDIADCLMMVAYELLGGKDDVFQQLSGTSLSGMCPGGLPVGDEIREALSATFRRHRGYGHSEQRGYNPGGNGRPNWPRR